MSSETELFYALGYCFFILLLFLLFKKFPPKTINHFYGYRTRRSMANEEIWQSANRYSLQIGVKLVCFSFIFPVLLYFIYPKQNFLVTVIANTALIVCILPLTEKYLDHFFDKNGNPKK